MNVVVARSPTDRSLLAEGASVNAIDDPLQHAHVLAVAGPQELPICIFAEPVHVEDAWNLLDVAIHLEPVAEVVAHVVSAERQHRHRIAAYFADGSGSSGRHFRTHGRACVHSSAPV